MNTYRAELHVHTVLSPCAGIEMIPPLIVDKALELGIQIIAITDHNVSANVEAVMQAAEGTDLTVIPGMELQTNEEIHSLCLFETLDQLEEFQHNVDQTLPDFPNNIEFFGEQFVVDKEGEFISREERLLINSTSLSVYDAFRIVKDLDGLFIPAHVNREAFGMISHLGTVPPDLPVTTLEISRHISPQKAIERFPYLKNYHLIQSGDVHFIDDFLASNQFLLAAPNLKEIKLALAGSNGRLHQIMAA
ncbi:MAG TPA: PHP domain-containing protein [Chloroflexi bacterium]|nr:PHP domain-containing protein [Anaerolineaceae bacterium]HHX09562.1 PHP domain-containing protein [Chloroflexota bacterium]